MEQRVRALSGPAALLAGAAGLAALFGTYWDDAWHTDRGRDDFFIPPHITLYAGVTVSGLVVAAWLLRAYLHGGGGRAGIGAVLASPPALLALVGASSTLLSAPIDNAWHEVYGRDSVLWSPPHMLGVAGSAAMSVGLLAGLAGRSDRLARATRVLLAAGVMGAMLVPVLEYDSDVPQLPVWTYWPVVTAGLVLFLLLARDLAPGRWTATAFAGAFTAAKAAIIVALAVMDHTGTLLPPVLVVAVIDDLLHRRGAGDVVRALAVAAVVPPAWAVAVALQPGVATQVPADEAVLGIAGSVVAALLVLAGTGRIPLHRAAGRGAAVAGLVVAGTLALQAPPVPAWAHDPGQGELVGQAAFEATRSGDTVELSARLAPEGHSCHDLRPVEAVARRAGEVLTAPLTLSGCDARSTMTVPDNGLWFLYVVLEDTAAHHEQAQQLEAWVPLHGNEQRAAESRDLYLNEADLATGPTTGQVAAGVVLYTVVTGLLLAAVRLSRRTRVAQSVQHGPSLSEVRAA